MTKKQVGEKSVYSTFTMETLLLITKRGQDWNSSRSESRSWCGGHGGIFLTGLLPLVCSVCSLIEPKNTCQQMVLPTRGPSPSPWSLIEKMPHNCISWRHFPNWNSFLCDNSSLCQIDIKLVNILICTGWFCVSTCHRLELLQRKELQLQKCLHEI